MKSENSPISRVRELFKYDHETGVIVWRIDPSIRNKVAGKICGHPDKHGYTQMRVDGRQRLAHRVAWAVYFGEWPDGQIDHINGIKNDNRIENLRIATPSQNSANKGIQKTNKHGIKGITPLPSGKWQAQIKVNNKSSYLGCFANKEDAANAYESAARLAFGEFFNAENRA